MKSYFIKSFFVRLLGTEEGEVLPQKPKLIFLHGLLGNGQNWLSIAKELQEKFTILLMDQRGHGKSEHLKGEYSPEEFSKDLNEVLEHLGWDEVMVVGHSLGGRVLFDFANRFPEKLQKAVIEDMGPHKTSSASMKTRQMIESAPVPFASRGKAKAFFDQNFKSTYGSVLADYMYSNMAKKADGTYDWRFDKEGALKTLEIGRTQDFWKDYMAISCPVLIIRGDASEHLPKDIYKEMLSQNQRARGVEIKNAGHWVHFDQRDAFVEALQNFLKDEL